MASLCPRNYYTPLDQRTTVKGSVIRHYEGTETGGGKKPKQIRFLLSLERRGLERDQGLRLGFQSVSRAPSPLQPREQRGDKTGPSTTPPLSSRHRQGRRPRDRPGRARPAISSPVIRPPALGPGPASSASPGSARTPRTPPSAGLRTRGSPGRRAGKAHAAAPHLGVEKGHAARFGIVLIRAVRHLGVKSLLPLHAGRKRFSLAGLGEAEGEREPGRGRRGRLLLPTPRPRDAPSAPPAAEGAGPDARAPSRPGPERAVLHCAGAADRAGRGRCGPGGGSRSEADAARLRPPGRGGKGARTGS